MGSIYRLNSFYEWELQNFPNPLYLNTNLKIKANSLQYAFAGLLKEEDELFLEHYPNIEFIEYLNKKFNKKVHFTNTLSANKNIIEWGMIHKIYNKTITQDIETIQLHKHISSKLKQAELRKKFFPYLPKRIPITNISELETKLTKLKFPILLKPDQTLSGVGTFIIKTKEDIKNLFKDLEAKLKTQIYFIEEWKEKIFDFSALCDSQRGFISLTIMNVDSTGKYRSSEIFHDEEIKKNYCVLLENLSKNSFLPKGRFSIDGFVYSEDGTKRYNYISEINPRWTMGWLLYEFQKQYGDSGKLKFITNHYNSNLNSFQLEEMLRKNLNAECIILLSPSFLEQKKLSNILVFQY